MLTETQKEALGMMAEAEAGAVWVDGKWIFPQDVRDSEEIACAVVRHYTPTKQIIEDLASSTRLLEDLLEVPVIEFLAACHRTEEEAQRVVCVKCLQVYERADWYGEIHRAICGPTLPTVPPVRDIEAQGKNAIRRRRPETTEAYDRAREDAYTLTQAQRWIDQHVRFDREFATGEREGEN